MKEENFTKKEKIEWLSNLKEVKKLVGGLSAKKVTLLEHDIVKKEYDLSKEGKTFKHELKILKHLTKKKCPYTPKLYSWEKRNGIIYMEYVGGGEEVKLNYTNQKQIKNIMNILEHEYGVKKMRQKKHFLQKWFMNTFRYKNVINNAIRNNEGKMFLIDFGSSSWKLIQ